MRVTILFLAALAACGPRTDLGVNFDIEEIQGQNESMENFQSMVEAEFGLSLGDTWREVDVWWSDSSCDGREGYGIQMGGDCVSGVAMSNGLYIALSNGDESRTCGTSLIHELAHYLSYEAWGESSYCANSRETHPGPIWEVVERANRIACSEGW